MRVYRAPRRVIWLWMIRLGIAFFGIVAALKMFHVKQILNFAITTATVIIAAAVVIYLCVYVKKYTIQVSATAITVKSGVIIKKERILPSPRLIFVEVYATPLERLLGLEVIALRAVKARLFTMPVDAQSALEILGEVSGNR